MSKHYPAQRVSLDNKLLMFSRRLGNNSTTKCLLHSQELCISALLYTEDYMELWKLFTVLTKKIIIIVSQQTSHQTDHRRNREG